MQEVSQAIKSLIIDKHGPPDTIITDNGLEFNNRLITELAERFGITWKFGSLGHHHATGAVERVNQTLFNKVKALCNFRSDCWDSMVPSACKAVNLSFNRSIQTCPYLMAYGTVPDLEIDSRLTAPKTIRNRTLLWQNHRDHREAYNRDIVKGKKLATNNFQTGDQVVIFKEVLGEKCASRWHPGYTIVQSIQPDSFTVTNGKSTLRLNKAHIKRAPEGEGNVVTIEQ